MKNTTEYTYTFANGETMTLDEEQVSKEWIDLLEEMDREEYNNNQTETRRHCSLQARDPRGKVLVAPADGFEDLRLKEAWASMKRFLTRREQSVGESFFVQELEMEMVAHQHNLSVRRTQEIVALIKSKLRKMKKSSRF